MADVGCDALLSDSQACDPQTWLGFANLTWKLVEKTTTTTTKYIFQAPTEDLPEKNSLKFWSIGMFRKSSHWTRAHARFCRCLWVHRSIQRTVDLLFEHPCSVFEASGPALRECSRHLGAERICYAWDQFPRINQLHLLKSRETNKLNFLMWPCLHFKLDLSDERPARDWQPVYLVHSSLLSVVTLTKCTTQGGRISIMCRYQSIRWQPRWSILVQWARFIEVEGLCENCQWNSFYLADFLIGFSLELTFFFLFFFSKHILKFLGVCHS